MFALDLCARNAGSIARAAVLCNLCAANVYDGDANADGMGLAKYTGILCRAGRLFRYLILKSKGNLNHFYFMLMRIDRSGTHARTHTFWSDFGFWVLTKM